MKYALRINTLKIASSKRESAVERLQVTHHLTTVYDPRLLRLFSLLYVTEYRQPEKGVTLKYVCECVSLDRHAFNQLALCICNQINQWSTIYPEKLIFSQLVKKFSAF